MAVKALLGEGQHGWYCDGRYLCAGGETGRVPSTLYSTHISSIPLFPHSRTSWHPLTRPSCWSGLSPVVRLARREESGRSVVVAFSKYKYWTVPERRAEGCPSVLEFPDNKYRNASSNLKYRYYTIWYLPFCGHDALTPPTPAQKHTLPPRRLQYLAAFLPAELALTLLTSSSRDTETARCPTKEMPASRLSKCHTTLAERGFSHRNDGLAAQEDLEYQCCWHSAQRSIFMSYGKSWLWSWSTTRNPSCQSPFPSQSQSQSPILLPFSHLHIRHDRSHKLLQCLSPILYPIKNVYPFVPPPISPPNPIPSSPTSPKPTHQSAASTWRAVPLRSPRKQ